MLQSLLPSSPSRYLRRVGYGHNRENGTVVIPSTIQELLDEYEVDATEGPGLTWDFMWNANVEEGREKRLMRQAFTQTVEDIPSAVETTSEPVGLAEAAMKVGKRLFGVFFCLTGIHSWPLVRQWNVMTQAKVP